MTIIVTSPGTPLVPSVAASAAVHTSFTLEEFLRRRIGKGQTIWSTGDIEGAQKPKYVCHPLRYQLNIQAYLAGELWHIYGSTLLLPDGNTYVFCFDINKPELDAHVPSYLAAFSAAGAAPVYWHRRPGRGHLELYFDRPVDPQAIYAWAATVCPEITAMDVGCYPYNGATGRVSWPLYQRVGNVVKECPVECMLPGDQVPTLSTGVESDRGRLTRLLSQAVTPADCIPQLTGAIVPTPTLAPNQTLAPQGKESDREALIECYIDWYRNVRPTEVLDKIGATLL